MSKRIIFHACDWDLDAITDNLETIADMGFNYIQTSPVTPVKQEGYENWIKYQPTDLRVEENTKAKLVRLCKEAEKYGIKIVVDVVLRHLAGKDDGSLYPHEKCNPDIVGRSDFWLPAYHGYNAHNRDECTKKCWGMPSLNYFNHDLQDIYIKFLDELIEYGVYSFRVDMAKHFALPEEGCDFWTRVFGRYADRFCYGECIDLEHYYLEMYSKYIAVLTEQMFNNDGRLVTWVESHDTYHFFKTTRHMSDDMRLREWDILLSSHDNVLWFSRPFDGLFGDPRLKNINLKWRG